MRSRIFTRGVVTVGSILNGERIVGSTLKPVLSHTGDLLCQYLPIENFRDQLPQICEDAQRGFLEWNSISPFERAEILRSAGKLVELNLQKYIDAHIAIGSGKVFAEQCALNSVKIINECANMVSRPEGVVARVGGNELAMVVRTPVGPVLSIAPWNAPTPLWARAIFGPLASGCSVLAKGTEKEPVISSLYVEHLLEAGLPKKAIQLFYVNEHDHEEATNVLIADPRVAKINFTGSSKVGALIAKQAGQHLKPVLLELGGKNFSIIQQDADIQKAAAVSLLSGWMHMGQICMAVDNIYVHESVYDEFRAAILSEAGQLSKIPDFNLSQRDEGGAKKVEAMVNEAVESGASVMHGEHSKAEGSLYRPIILENVTGDMKISSEEIFGPVVSLIKYSDTDELVEHINSSRYGLKSSIWSKNTLAAIALARRIDAGAVHINSSTVQDEATTPHGGVKNSGMGRFNGAWSIEEFTYAKTILVDQ